MDSENVLFEIVVGTYEKFLLGYYLELHSDEFCLRPSFVTESHLQSIRCLASNNKYLASGSTDETIQLYNLKSRNEIGSLIHHDGTVTSLEFYDSYLISSSEDKSICIWSTSNWQCMKTLSGHKNAVNCVSIHPSGKMALSVSKDKTLRTWNLIKGRSAYVTNIKKDAELVRWTLEGLHFAVIQGSSIDVYSVESASVLHSIDAQHKICDMTFIKDAVCAVVGESENVYLYDLITGSLCYEFKAHKARIKAVKSLIINDEMFLVTASSDGYVKVWHMDLTESEYKIRKLVKIKTGSRPTCMTLIARQ